MRLARFAICSVGMLSLLVITGTTALASSPLPTPEISGTSISAGLGFLAAGVLIVRSRMKSK